MELTKAFKDPIIAQVLLDKLRSSSTKASLMEVCGTHTMEFFKTGINSALPEQIKLISGPGCPVCVTPLQVIDIAVMLAQKKSCVLFCFGDMMRVPGTNSSLSDAKAEGANVRIMYSPMEALEYASNNPSLNVILFGVGFETTIPLFAATILAALQRKIKNLYLISAFKLIPPALRMLLDSPKSEISGFILPGHVSAVIGAQAYNFLEKEYRMPAVITGFDSVDLLEGLLILLKMISKKEYGLKNQYRRFVTDKGNQKAIDVMGKVFVSCDAKWRGLGVIPNSGLSLNSEYSNFDAKNLIDFVLPEEIEPRGCICGEVIQGNKRPPECPLFRVNCSPQTPVGACMVSSEGTCAAYYKYQRK